MEKRKKIDEFLACRSLAVAGVSRNTNKFGNAIYREFKKRGMTVYPLNPNVTEIEGDPCYSSPEKLPRPVEGLIAAVNPGQCLQVVRDAHAAGINKIWLQQGSQSDEALAFGEEHGMTIVAKECIFMYSEPVTSIHRFHRGMAKLFGKYQKQAV